MRSLDKKLSRLALAAVLFAAGWPAFAAQDAAVVTVGDASKSAKDGTLWGLATRYMPAETQGKKTADLTDAEKTDITKRLLALQLYHNALAADRNQGRPITDRNLIFKGEKLYLPPQSVIDQIVALMPANPTSKISAAKRDQLMRTVLRDVADNKTVIQQSKAGTNLTSTVLADAEQVKNTDTQSDSNLAGTGSTSSTLLSNVARDQELTDESNPTDAVVLGPDGKPVSGGSASIGAGDSTSGTVADGSSIVDLTEKSSVLESLLVSIQAGAEDASNPNRAKLRELATKIQNELIKRKREEQKQKDREAASAAATSAATTTASAPSTASTSKPASASGKPATEVASAEGGPSSEPIEMEYVPDWYLKALQEWNLSQYWQSKASKTPKGKATGRRKVLDPLTGKEKVADDGDSPFGEFSDELTNYTHEQGQVEKRPGQ